MDDILSADVVRLDAQLKAANIPPDLRLKAEEMLARVTRQAKYGNYSIDWITHLPWNVSTTDTLDLGHVKQVLDSHHFGLEELKERFLEYISVMILNKKSANSNFRAPILLLVGLVGTGKTTIARSIADALGRKFVRLPFGGMSSAIDLRGQSSSLPDIKGIRRSGSKNPVFLLDELDRVSDSARGEIMGVLVELLDPEQNMTFTDHFLDFPFDLSQVMFIGTANNTTHISPAVMDRLEPVMMPSYTDEEKIRIAKDYILPAQLKKASLGPDVILFDDSVWPKIARPLGFDAGIRTLERTIEGIVRKISKLIVEGKGNQFTINDTNLKQFLPTY
jgi:ATP-dependent Lon protease